MNPTTNGFETSKLKKTSSTDQCTDIMTRLLERSDPFQLELKNCIHKRMSRQPKTKKRAEVDPVVNELNQLVNELLF